MAEATDDRLRLLIERVERLEEERKGLSDDIRDVYAEAKAVGYDAQIMRLIITWAVPRSVPFVAGFYALALLAWSLVGDPS